MMEQKRIEFMCTFMYNTMKIYHKCEHILSDNMKYLSMLCNSCIDRSHRFQYLPSGNTASNTYAE